MRVVGLCISRPPILALALNLYLPYLAPNLYLPALVPNLYLPVLVYNFITSPGPEFCIYQPCLFQLFVFTALAHDLYYHSGACICIYLIIGSSISGSCNSSSSNFFGIYNICMSILVNLGIQTEVCTHTGC